MVVLEIGEWLVARDGPVGHQPDYDPAVLASDLDNIDQAMMHDVGGHPDIYGRGLAFICHEALLISVWVPTRVHPKGSMPAAEFCGQMLAEFPSLSQLDSGLAIRRWRTRCQQSIQERDAYFSPISALRPSASSQSSFASLAYRKPCSTAIAPFCS